MKIRLLITGRNYHSLTHLPADLLLAEPSTVDDALARLSDLLPPGERFPGSCLVSVAGRHLGTIARHESPRLHEGDELCLIAPMAGG